MRTAPRSLVVGALLLAAACADDDGGSLTVDLGDDGTTMAAPGEGGAHAEVPHALADSPGWATVEHHDPAPGEGPVMPPPFDTLDWSSAYERARTSGGTTSVDRVAVQGLAVDAAALAEQLAGQRYQPGPLLAGRSTLVGRPVQETEPAIVLVDAGGGTTVVLLSYELGPDELLDWGVGLRFVSEAEWAAVPSQG